MLLVLTVVFTGIVNITGQQLNWSNWLWRLQRWRTLFCMRTSDEVTTVWCIKGDAKER